MKAQRRPPVPPLSESAVARLERQVFAALDGAPLPEAPVRRPSRWWYGIAFATAAVGAFAVVAVRHFHATTDDGGARGARITTAAAGSHVTLEGAVVDVAPQSAIRFGAESGDGVAVVLERGAVTCEVAPRSHRAPFVVQAGGTRVTVIGTRFRVQRVGAHASVFVDHGTVEVGDGGMTQILHAGDRYQPAEDEQSGDVVPAATTPAPVTPAPAALAAPPLRRRPVVAVSSPRAERAGVVAPRSDGDGDRQSTPVAAPAQALNAAVEQPNAPVEQPRAPVVTPPVVRPTVAQRFENAARQETSDPAAALAIYAQLAAGDGTWAADALFAQGRLELERGHHSQARALLAAYLHRFPDGPNADDAHRLLQRLR